MLTLLNALLKLSTSIAGACKIASSPTKAPGEAKCAAVLTTGLAIWAPSRTRGATASDFSLIAEAAGPPASSESVGGGPSSKTCSISGICNVSTGKFNARNWEYYIDNNNEQEVSPRWRVSRCFLDRLPSARRPQRGPRRLPQRRPQRRPRRRPQRRPQRKPQRWPKRRLAF